MPNALNVIVHLSQQCDDICSPVDLVLPTGPDRSQAVDLVKENDGWTHLVRLGTNEQVNLPTHSLSKAA